MAINEVFPNPTVKQVVFQIRFPNLFYLENRIGDLQLKIMKEFPESSLIYRRQVVFADIGPEGKLEELPPELEKRSRKIWQFRSPKNYRLNVLNDSLDITSEFHKSYNLSSENKFRDMIKFVVDSFFEFAPIPTITRIGLRYIDECPIPSKENSVFKSYYNTSFPLDRFDLALADEMHFKALVKNGDYYLRYVESLQKGSRDNYKLILDFDGFANDIKKEDYLNVTDKLHSIILNEYEKSIKGPVYDYMRQERKDGDEKA